jgi:transcription initiation factor TFIIIB Brf1 subunit/transcription initiation factor TFIIB
MKKTNCIKCNSKTAVFDQNSGMYKCHICGTKFEEKSKTIKGDFNITLGEDGQFKRYIVFEVPKENCKVEEKGDKVSVTIYENV